MGRARADLIGASKARRDAAVLKGRGKAAGQHQPPGPTRSTSGPFD